MNICKLKFGTIFIISWLSIALIVGLLPKIDRLNNWYPIIEPAKNNGRYIRVNQSKNLAHATITLEAVVNNKDSFYGFFKIDTLKGDSSLDFELIDDNGVDYSPLEVIPTGNRFFKDLMVVYPPLLPDTKEVTFRYEKFNNAVSFTLNLDKCKGD
jgi:hypothetical protein